MAAEFSEPIDFTCCEPPKATPIATVPPDTLPDTLPEEEQGDPDTTVVPPSVLPVWVKEGVREPPPPRADVQVPVHEPARLIG